MTRIVLRNGREIDDPIDALLDDIAPEISEEAGPTSDGKGASREGEAGSVTAPGAVSPVGPATEEGAFPRGNVDEAVHVHEPRKPWNPLLHPRNRIGWFRDVLATLFGEGTEAQGLRYIRGMAKPDQRGEFVRDLDRSWIWNGWRKLKPGDRVVSWDPRTGKVLARGTFVAMPKNREGRRASLGYLVSHYGMRVQWDGGKLGRVIDPARMLRREEGPFTPDEGAPELRYERVEREGYAKRGPAATTTRFYWRAVRVSDGEQIATGATREEAERNAVEILRIARGMAHPGESEKGDGWFVSSDGVKRWGRYGAAGVLLRHTDPDGTVRYFLTKRGEGTDEAGTWGLPGGALDRGEDPLQGALRELREETGIDVAGDEVHRYVFQPVPEWAYTTVVVDVPSRNLVTNPDERSRWETDTVGWFTADELRGLALHPGVRDALESGNLLPTGMAHPGEGEAQSRAERLMRPSDRENLALLAGLRDAVHAADDAWLEDLDNKEKRDAYRKAMAAYRDAEKQALAEGTSTVCGRCGGKGYIEWGNVYFETGRGSERTCFACGGSGLLPLRKERFPAQPPTRAKRAAEAQAQRDREAQEAEARLAEFATSFPDEAQLLRTKGAPPGGPYYSDDEGDDYNEFLTSLRRQIEAGRPLSEKQMAALSRNVERDRQEREAAAKREAAGPLQGGKRHLSGEIVAVKDRPGYMGGTVWKMLVLLDDGNKVWGTCPEAVWQAADEDGGGPEGMLVEFDATVERSQDDEHFGFFKSPRKVVAKRPEEPEAMAHPGDARRYVEPPPYTGEIPEVTDPHDAGMGWSMERRPNGEVLLIHKQPLAGEGTLSVESRMVLPNESEARAAVGRFEANVTVDDATLDGLVLGWLADNGPDIAWTVAQRLSDRGYFAGDTRKAQGRVSRSLQRLKERGLVEWHVSEWRAAEPDYISVPTNVKRALEKQDVDAAAKAIEADIQKLADDWHEAVDDALRTMDLGGADTAPTKLSVGNGVAVEFIPGTGDGGWPDLFFVRGPTGGANEPDAHSAAHRAVMLVQERVQRKQLTREQGGTPYTAAGDIESLEEIANAHYLNARFQLDNIDLELGREAVEQIDRILTAFPPAAKMFNGVRVPDEPKPLCWAWHQWGWVSLNKHYWTDTYWMTEGMRDAVESGWHPPGTDTVAALMTHEFMHTLDDALDADPRYRREWGAFKRRYADRFKRLSGEQAALATADQLDYDPDFHPSIYGASHIREGIAEAGAEIAHSDADLSDFAVALNVWLVEHGFDTGALRPVEQAAAEPEPAPPPLTGPPLVVPARHAMAHPGDAYERVTGMAHPGKGQRQLFKPEPRTVVGVINQDQLDADLEQLREMEVPLPEETIAKIREAIDDVGEVIHAPEFTPGTFIALDDFENVKEGETAFGPDVDTGEFIAVVRLHYLLRPLVMKATVEHELGHVMDIGLGDGGNAWSVGRSKDAVEFRKLLRRTSPIRDISQARANARAAGDRDFVAHADYLLQPMEMFARAFAQWIAMKKDDGETRIHHQWVLQQVGPYAWPEDEFEPVGEMLDRIFSNRGLLKLERPAREMTEEEFDQAFSDYRDRLEVEQEAIERMLER